MSGRPTFREVIRPPLWLISFIYFMLFSLVIAIWAAFDNQTAVIAFIISIVIGAGAIVVATSEILVQDGELRIQRAHIPLKYLGEITLIPKSEFSFARTRGADPAAYFATTFWISEGIKVSVIDQRDPTPYWLISTKRASELASAIKS